MKNLLYMSMYIGLGLFWGTSYGMYERSLLEKCIDSMQIDYVKHRLLEEIFKKYKGEKISDEALFPLMNNNTDQSFLYKQAVQEKRCEDIFLHGYNVEAANRVFMEIHTLRKLNTVISDEHIDTACANKNKAFLNITLLEQVLFNEKKIKPYVEPKSGL
jgi:hypothetical protein